MNEKILSRSLDYLGSWLRFRHEREDMPHTWKETVGWQFLKHVLTFKFYRPRILQLLEGNHKKDVIVFKNRREARNYLKSLK